MELSVVILARNESRNIERAIASSFLISEDIIVVDTGSTDDTRELAANAGARVIEIPWQGFGASRNHGAAQAKQDWIFVLDADERITHSLAGEIKKLSPQEEAVVYKMKRQNFFGAKKIEFGDWKKDTVKRLYNRNTSSWNLAAVHESLITDALRTIKLKGTLEHHTAENLNGFLLKNLGYAKLGAGKLQSRSSLHLCLKMVFAPIFSFVRGYFFRLGWLDGKEGFWIARINSYYTFMKYANALECKN